MYIFQTHTMEISIASEQGWATDQNVFIEICSRTSRIASQHVARSLFLSALINMHNEFVKAWSANYDSAKEKRHALSSLFALSCTQTA